MTDIARADRDALIAASMQVTESIGNLHTAFRDLTEKADTLQRLVGKEILPDTGRTRILLGFETSIYNNVITVKHGVVAVPGLGIHHLAEQVMTVPARHWRWDRIDVIAIVVWNDEVDASGKTGPEIVYLEGSSGGGTPPLPVGAVRLANVYMPMAGMPTLQRTEEAT